MIGHASRAGRGLDGGAAAEGPDDAGPDEAGAAGDSVEATAGDTAGWMVPSDPPGETDEG